MPSNPMAIAEFTDDLDWDALVADVAQRISEDGSDGERLVIEYNHALGDGDGYDPKDPDHRAGLKGFARHKAEELLQEAIYHLQHDVAFDDAGNLVLWREMVVRKGWEDDAIHDRPLGVCWAWEREAAEAHHGFGHADPAMQVVRLQAAVLPGHVDWRETVALNAAAEYTVGEEKEIRLTSYADATILGIEVRKGAGDDTYEAIDASHLAGKVLRAGEDAEDPHDEFHGEAMERTGFWGDKGAGSLIVARSTGRVLIPFRSRDVLQPHTWGTWGGALDPGLTFERGALREVRQEAGHDIAVELVPIYKFERHEDGELVFAYQNFIALVDDEFEPTLNWETEEARWFEFGDWPAPLHFGLEAVLKDEASVAALREACQPAAPRPGA